MAASSSGGLHNLNDSKAQAFQALLSSLASNEDDVNGNADRANLVQNLSEKLDQIMGDPTSLASAEQGRNVKGELVNEEGLPIIDITEPVSNVIESETQYNSTPLVDSYDLDPPVVLSSLPPDEHSRRIAERNRILDLLEQEERLEAARDRELEREQKRAAVEKRKEAARVELERLRKAQEVQRKMAKALVGGVGGLREFQVQKDSSRRMESPAEQERPVVKIEEHVEKGKKKSVSFAVADLTDEPAIADESTSVDWGDVVPAKLQRKLLVPKDNQPMKMTVVERVPGSGTIPLQKQPDEAPQQPPYDSDDESQPGSPSQSDLASDGDDDESTVGEDDEFVEDEFDLDAARHQREVALAYFEKRATIGAAAAQAMRSHTHDPLEDGGEHEWDQPEVPLEATLAHPPPKPSVSRFKSSLFQSSSSPSNTSLGSSVLPAPHLRRALRTGKLENETLVGGEQGDSASEGEDGEAAEALLEMLRRGDLVNVGPEGQVSAVEEGPRFSTPPGSVEPSSNDAKPASSSSTAMPSARQSPSQAQSGLSQRKVSKFKQAHSRPRIITARAGSLDMSGADTPITSTTRSSPKLSDSSLWPNAITGHLDPKAMAAVSFPTVIASPSFPLPSVLSVPQVASPTELSPGSGDPAAMVIGSHSFRPPAKSSAAFTGVIDSPSFPPGSGERGNQPATIIHSPSFRPPPNTGSNNGPPTPVRETTSHRSGSTDESGRVSHPEKKKVSRFMSERM